MPVDISGDAGAVETDPAGDLRLPGVALDRLRLARYISYKSRTCGEAPFINFVAWAATCRQRGLTPRSRFAAPTRSRLHLQFLGAL